MTDSAAAEAMKVVADATSGPGTPDTAAVVARPERSPVWALILAGPAISAMVCSVLWLLAYKIWPEASASRMEALMRDVVRAIAAIGCILSVILGLIVFRLASGGLKRVEAKAGPAELTVSTGD